MRELLLCPPDHYSIQYEINPWMSRAQEADKDLVMQQWKNLHRELSALDTKVHVITAGREAAGHGLHRECRARGRPQIYPE